MTAMNNETENAPPYAIRRDKVKDDREMVPFWLRSETKEQQENVKREVEELLGYDVYLTDFKEAAYLHGLENPLEIASQLEDWGCEYA